MPSTHEFKVHENILVQLIKRQAGSLEKALEELHMNSVDAGCSNTKLEISQEGFVFEDDGKGFANEQEIHDLFGCVGWPHEEGSRVYGEFGLGRLQVLNYASTDWMTNGMQMSVDINNKGLSYEVLRGTNAVKGLRIEGRFFKCLELRDLINVIAGYKTAVKYSPVPAFLNAERIDVDRSKVKWTHETDQAFILIRNSMRDIAVYNQGVYVRDYPAHQFGGCGGVVVTKPGMKLVLNTARNDIISQECKVWSKIKPFLMDQAKVERKKSVTFTESDVRFMRDEFDCGEISEVFFAGKFIKDIQGRLHSFKSLGTKSWWSQNVAMGEPKNRALLSAHEAKAAVVFDKVSLETLGCETIGEFSDLFKRVKEVFEKGRYYGFDKAKLLVDTSEIENQFRGCSHIIAREEYSKEERLFLACLEKCNNTIYFGAAGSRFLSDGAKKRALVLGQSVGMLAWTNGINFIALEREYLKAQFKKGLAGVLHVCNTLVHEYCHPDSSEDADVHSHGLDFYARFHDLVGSEIYSYVMSYTAVHAYNQMVKQAVKAGIALNQTHLTQGSQVQLLLQDAA